MNIKSDGLTKGLFNRRLSLTSNYKKKKTWRWKMHTYTRGFLSIIMESMSGLLIPCLSGLQNDRPYPDNARFVCSKSNSTTQSIQILFGYSTSSHDLPNSNFIFPYLPSKIGKSPISPAVDQKTSIPGPRKSPAAPTRRPGWSPASSQR